MNQSLTAFLAILPCLILGISFSTFAGEEEVALKNRMGTSYRRFVRTGKINKFKWIKNRELGIKQLPLLKDYLDLVHLPGGSFMMGSPESEDGRYCNEKQHPAKVDAFWVMRTHLTRQEWRRFMGKNPRYRDCGFTKTKWESGPNKPVTCISFDEAEELVEVVNADLKRLEMNLEAKVISEKQQEYLQRLWVKNGKLIISNTAYPWGDDPNQEMLNKYVVIEGESKEFQDVMTKDPIFGIYDARGNVWSWTTDFYDSSERVIRGSGPGWDPRFLRSGFRNHRQPEVREHYLSVRLAIVPLAH